MRVEGLPRTGEFVVNEVEAGGCPYVVEGLAGEKAGKDVLGEDVEGLRVGEGGGGGGEGVEGGELKAGKTMLEGLLVREFVEDDPDDAMGLEGGDGGVVGGGKSFECRLACTPMKTSLQSRKTPKRPAKERMVPAVSTMRSKMGAKDGRQRAARRRVARIAERRGCGPADAQRVEIEDVEGV